MSGREVTPSLAAVAEGVARSDSGGGQQPWKTALAVILPVLAVTLLAWQVSCGWLVHVRRVVGWLRV